jgi:phospholipase C
MKISNSVPRRDWRLTTALHTSIFALSAFAFATTGDSATTDVAASAPTASPIKHVIILIGENRGLDHTYGVYKPKGAGQTIDNMLSKGIIKADGAPGPKYHLAQQYSVIAQSAWYFGEPKAAKFPYSGTNLIPQPNTNGAPQFQSTTGAPFTSVAVTKSTGETDINNDDFDLLTTGATDLLPGSLDTRVPGAGALAGPFVLQGPNIADDDYTGDMTHRF